MSTWVEGIGIVCAAIVSLIGAGISIKNRKHESRKVESETNLNEAQQSAIVGKLVNETEEMYLRRIESFKDDIVVLRREIDSLRSDLADQRDESGMLEDFFFNRHQPWDRKFVQAARDEGMEIEDPPSWLLYLREKEQERQQRNEKK